MEDNERSRQEAQSSKWRADFENTQVYPPPAQTLLDRKSVYGNRQTVALAGIVIYGLGRAD
jgi:hypothetical protein